MTTAKQQIARMRQELDLLEQIVDDAEAGEGPEIDLDAWIERNKDAINASLIKDDEAMARGEYIEGTADELLDYFLEKARNRAKATQA